MLDEEEEEAQSSFVTKNRQIRNTSVSGPIVERHNFERDMRIEITNTQHRPITQVERQIVESLDKVVNQTDGTRIIDLRNKHVPKGIQFAIAVDSKKFYSKNALKKITRNLAKQI